jgi:transcriptional regulator with XRE-family HTH domain
METNELGRLIREARLRRGWTQEDVANRLGVKDSYVSQWETGARRWPQEYVRPLAALLGLSQVEMAVAAGLIDPPADAPPRVAADFRIQTMAEVWPRVRPDVRAAVYELFRQLIAVPGMIDEAEEPPVVAVSR